MSSQGQARNTNSKCTDAKSGDLESHTPLLGVFCGSGGWWVVDGDEAVFGMPVFAVTYSRGRRYAHLRENPVFKVPVTSKLETAEAKDFYQALAIIFGGRDFHSFTPVHLAQNGQNSCIQVNFSLSERHKCFSCAFLHTIY